MTNKIQYSKKFPDGTILVVGGDTVEEFVKNYTEFRKTDVAKNIFQETVATNNSPPVQTSAATPHTQTNAGEWVELPNDALLEITFKGKSYHGEISPFPGTKYPVKIWPEVVETIQGFDPKDGELDVGGRQVMYIENDKGFPQKVTAIK